MSSFKTLSGRKLLFRGGSRVLEVLICDCLAGDSCGIREWDLDYELLLVDDGSKDKSWGFNAAGELKSICHMIVHSEDGYPTHTVNAGQPERETHINL